MPASTNRHRRRIKFSAELEKEMWDYLKELIKVQKSVLPKGLNVWKMFLERNPTCGKNAHNLASHYRKIMEPNLFNSSLTREEKEFLASHLNKSSLEARRGRESSVNSGPQQGKDRKMKNEAPKKKEKKPTAACDDDLDNASGSDEKSAEQKTNELQISSPPAVVNANTSRGASAQQENVESETVISSDFRRTNRNSSSKQVREQADDVVEGAEKPMEEATSGKPPLNDSDEN